MALDENDLIRTRTTLIHRLKNWEDQSSWQEFFDTYWKPIYGVARKAGLNDAEAQDVVQETMLSVAKHMPSFHYDRKIGSFKAWLFTMTKWRVVDQARKRKSPANSKLEIGEEILSNDFLNEIMDPSSEHLEKIWDDEWKKSILETAVNRVKRTVDPKQFQIFDLCTNKGWSTEDVASKFAMTVGNVYVSKHRVTEMIRSEVSRLGKEGALSTEEKQRDTNQ